LEGIEQLNKKVSRQEAVLSRQEAVLSRQEKLSVFMAKEVVIQHRIRTDVWSSSKRTAVEQHDFKEKLIHYYDASHSTNSNMILCMMLKNYFRKDSVIASHIWKFYTEGEGLEEFGLAPTDLSNPRNGFL
jgi:arginine deiminase